MTSALESREFKTVLKDAEQGTKSAQYDLYLLYKEGKGCQVDLSLAHNWLVKSAEQGYAPAEYALSENYMKGIQVPVDNETAISWLKRATAQDYPQACLTQARCLYHGHLMPSNPTEAFVLYKKAGESGIADALTELGEIAFWEIFENRNDALKDLRHMHDYLKVAADLGDSQSQSHYGLCLKEGYGIEKNYEQAKEYLQRAANGGIGMAYYGLADMCENGLGTLADRPKAYELYLGAAKANVIPAQFKVGRAYMTGDGLAENLVEAAYWFRKAADKNHEDSKCYLGGFYLAGLGGMDQDIVQGERLLKEVSATGNLPLADFMLGMHYLEQDQGNEAILHLQKASDAGDQRATNMLQSIEVENK